ncbi:hypothetical protein HZH68_009673 [Vespula germanica]|uniref:Uncharacterized protein n=1 Tax=Vespula germanica TaxID=30212 RepID=A0A834JVY7_VESGE|nr:hypothetical protein HZH68_009673 [Vespula germanica]
MAEARIYTPPPPPPLAPPLPPPPPPVETPLPLLVGISRDLTSILARSSSPSKDLTSNEQLEVINHVDFIATNCR